jgi:hypothetical protein
MQVWVQLGMGGLAIVALAASAREGLRLFRDWRRSQT